MHMSKYEDNKTVSETNVLAKNTGVLCHVFKCSKNRFGIEFLVSDKFPWLIQGEVNIGRSGENV